MFMFVASLTLNAHLAVALGGIACDDSHNRA